jgi:uncharacterized protein YrrD
MSLLKELLDIIHGGDDYVYLDKDGDELEVVYVNEDGAVLSEEATTAFRRQGKKITRKFRCVSGEKKGRLVANPQTCVRRKSLARVLAGRKIASEKKNIRIRKSKIALKTNTSKMVRKANKRLKRMSAQRKPKTAKGIS